MYSWNDCLWKLNNNYSNQRNVVIAYKYSSKYCESVTPDGLRPENKQSCGLLRQQHKELYFPHKEAHRMEIVLLVLILNYRLFF